MSELRTAKTLGYYVSADCTDQLQRQYGSYLEAIDINDRNALMAILAYYTFINAVPLWEGTSFYDVATELFPGDCAPEDDRDVTSTEFSDILEILENITPDQARELLHAISS
ncbi:hypothetical protein [Phormidesmis sp. 146-33]